MNQFSELPLTASIHQNLVRNSFIEPTEVQAQAIPHALQGVDVVATAQTGTGKTLAFLLPMIEKLLKSPGVGVSALVLTPTRELALQINETFAQLAVGTGLRAAVVVGGMSEQTQLNAVKRGARLIVATPGRLEDFLGRRLVKLGGVETLVLDEADRMLDMGFLPAIERILSVLPASRQSLFFSATMDSTVTRLIEKYSNKPVRIHVGGATAKAPEQIDLHIYEVEHDRKLGLLRHMLSQEPGSFLVFARTKHGTDKLAKRLSAFGLRAVAMHGDRTQNQRNQALAGFRDGFYRVLVATDVAARGIHVDSVAHVVNYDLPQAPQDFIHRVGRTGRAGQRGTASTFSARSERGEIRRIERECKVRLERREVGSQILSERDEIATAVPFHDEKMPADRHPRQHRSPASKSAPFKGKKTFGGSKRVRAAW